MHLASTKALWNNSAMPDGGAPVESPGKPIFSGLRPTLDNQRAAKGLRFWDKASTSASVPPDTQKQIV